jgi:hypothetical protein
MELHKMIARVESKESFLEFIAALRADWESRGNKAEWENTDLGHFLEAMQSWTEDMGERIPASASWRTFAEMFYAAKMYE